MLFRSGLRVHRETPEFAALGAGGEDLLHLTGNPEAPRVDRAAGLYHFCLKVEDRRDFARWLAHLVATHTPLAGLVDHRFAEAIYLDDPEGKDSGEGEAGRNGALYVIKPGAQPEILSHTQLEGRCFGTPTPFNGKVYVQTTKKLYCFGKAGNNANLPEVLQDKTPGDAPGWPFSNQIIPSEVLLHPGEKATFRARSLYEHGAGPGGIGPGGMAGIEIDSATYKTLHWKSYIPPTAKVKAVMNATFNADGELIAGTNQVPSAGAFETYFNSAPAYIRGRVMPNIPLKQDFDSFTLSETNAAEGAAFAYPPLPWIGARFKFEVRERDGNKCLVKTIDNKFFQRATVFMGTPEMKNYTIEADVLSDGNRRKMSEVGVIAQRYAVILKGNEQKLEINSNLERLRVSTDFKWSPNVWYHLKARVDVAADGTGVVRAKAWKKGDPEPDAWTLEVPHKTAHQNGSPGLFGFAPQEQRVYIDNIFVTPTK